MKCIGPVPSCIWSTHFSCSEIWMQDKWFHIPVTSTCFFCWSASFSLLTCTMSYITLDRSLKFSRFLILQLRKCPCQNFCTPHSARWLAGDMGRSTVVTGCISHSDTWQQGAWAWLLFSCTYNLPRKHYSSALIYFSVTQKGTVFFIMHIKKHKVTLKWWVGTPRCREEGWSQY